MFCLTAPSFIRLQRVGEKLMNMAHCWEDNRQGKTEVLGVQTAPCNSTQHHRHHIRWPGIDDGHVP